MTGFCAYVISLRDRNSRRVELAGRLAVLDFEVEIFDAIDGRRGLGSALEKEVDRRAWLRRYARPATDAELACALSHREVYRRFLETDATHALIMEDDAIVGDRLNTFVATKGFMSAPIMLLDYGKAYVKGTGLPLLGVGSSAFALATTPFLATAYCVDRLTARLMLEAQSPVRQVADFPLDLPEHGGVALVPRIVFSPRDKRASTIGTRPEPTFTRKIRRLLGSGHLLRCSLKQWRKVNARKVPKDQL
ncbi:MAG: glycosyltransferase family 25 protein [Boseongicola sp. SB0662_bin_57]|nr:glycosyltransferase family 25 protein [Boseongicola sp. SB0662_bin_57]